MKDVFDFFIKRELVFTFLAISSAVSLFFYLALIDGLGYYRTALLSGVILAIGLGVVTTIRVLIHLLSKFSSEAFHGNRPRNLDGTSFTPIDVTIFLLRFFGMGIIAFCLTLGILGMSFFILKR